MKTTKVTLGEFLSLKDTFGARLGMPTPFREDFMRELWLALAVEGGHRPSEVASEPSNNGWLVLKRESLHRYLRDQIPSYAGAKERNVEDDVTEITQLLMDWCGSRALVFPDGFMMCRDGSNILVRQAPRANEYRGAKAKENG